MKAVILLNFWINLTSMGKYLFATAALLGVTAANPVSENTPRLAADNGKTKGSVKEIVSPESEKPASAGPAWQLEKDENGVQVYVKPASASSYRQVKAITRIPTTLSGMIALIKDDAASPRWMDRVVKFETIRKVNAHEWYTYAEIGIPWPFKNADVITKNNLTQAPDGVVTIDIQNTPDFVAKHKDKARVLRAGGSWVLTPHPDGVSVEYIFHAKPEGLSLPAWLVNAITVQSFHRSIERMRHLAGTDKYKSVQLPYIKQP